MILCQRIFAGYWTNDDGAAELTVRAVLELLPMEGKGMSSSSDETWRIRTLRELYSVISQLQVMVSEGRFEQVEHPSGDKYSDVSIFELGEGRVFPDHIGLCFREVNTGRLFELAGGIYRLSLCKWGPLEIEDHH